MGFVVGAASRLNVLATSNPETTDIPGAGGLVLQSVLWGIGGALFFLALRSGVRLWAMKVPGLDYERYLKGDTWTYSVFLLSLLGSVGMIFRPPLAAAMWGMFLLAHGLFVLSCLPQKERKSVFDSRGWLAFLFLISGFAALIYQIAWQRALFAIFGVNIESVTVIVSIFMFGLGVGALIGGWVSRKIPTKLPELFFFLEMGIGIFGVVSLSLIHWIGDMTLLLPLPGVALVVYALLALPTLFMGATLPLLVEYLTQRDPSVGRSVGTLYFVNTLGSALACFATASILFVWLGLEGAVYVAAAGNLITGVLVLRYCKRVGKKEAAVIAEPELRKLARTDLVSYKGVLLLSAVTGCLSLSQEIVWVRALGFMTAGSPAGFANVLGCFLFGIAMGSLWGKRACAKENSRAGFVGKMVQWASVSFVVAFVLMNTFGGESQAVSHVVLYFSVALTAFFSGACFPVICDLASDAGKDKGMTVSWMYVANIVGAMIGSLGTGFWVLENFGLGQIVPWLGGVGILIGSVIVLGNRSSKLGLVFGSVAVVLMIVGPKMFSGILENLQMTRPEVRPFKYALENRGGMITVEKNKDGDIVYGGGIYDGRYAVEPGAANGIHRAYVMACMHREPTKVLEIGMSTGSWAWVLAQHTAVKSMDIVEINPGYVELLRNYPEHSTLESNPKITIHVDDGRRWLNRHDEMFDFILMNTTYHWRSHATNLLSREFLEICQSHLNPGGIVYWNTTHSEAVVRTAADVFKHVTQWSNFVAASDSPFDMTADERRANLLRYEREGKPILEENEVNRKELEMLVNGPLPELKEELLERKELRVITDNNMATEFILEKHRLFDATKGWGRVF
jgi:spermidine synthase